jgi:uncharacterized protein
MKELVEKNKILELVTGSNLYGTNLPSSDRDYTGIFIASKPFYLGLDKVEEVDLSITSKSADGKNDSDAIDRKFHEFRKLVRLVADGNPNIIELVMVDEVRNNDCIVYINDFGRKLLANRELFPSKLVKQRFIGYSISQMHKAKTKPDNYLDLSLFKERFETYCLKPMYPTRLIEYKYNNTVLSELISFHTDFATIGGMNFNLNVKIIDVYLAIISRIEKASHRADMWTKYGMDTKFLAHAIRLMFEGKELLETGNIEFPLKQKDLLLDIRNGKFSLEEIHELADQTKNDLEGFEGDLPTKPNYTKINKFLIETVEEFWNQ